MITHTRVHLQTLVLLFFAGKHMKKNGKMSMFCLSVACLTPWMHQHRTCWCHVNLPSKPPVCKTGSTALTAVSIKDKSMQPLNRGQRGYTISLSLSPLFPPLSCLLTASNAILFPCVCMSPSVKREREKKKKIGWDGIDVVTVCPGGLWVT